MITPQTLLRRGMIWLCFWLCWRWQRYVVINGHVLESVWQQGGGLLSFWHNNIFSATVHCIKNTPSLFTLISGSKDGKDTQWAVGQFNNHKIVVGSHHSGGFAALYQLIKLMRKKQDFFLVTPDGSKGPRYRINANGFLLAAKRTQTPIIPLHVGIQRCWELGTWDRMRIPKPFAKSYLVCGDPIWLKPLEKKEPLAEQLLADSQYLEQEMNLHALRSLRLANAKIDPVLSKLCEAYTSSKEAIGS